MRLTSRLLGSVLTTGLLGLGMSLIAHAQNRDAVPPADPPVAAAAGESAAHQAAAATAPVKPRAAEIMPLAASRMLLDVRKVDGRYVAVGDRGDIVLSTDGATWTQVAGPVRALLTAVDFPDPQHGYAVGHDAAILMTRDGGTTWTLQQFKPERQQPLLDVLFLDANRGFAVGAYGLFQKTTDGGGSWVDVEAPAIREEELHLNAMVRLNDGTLFIIGEQGLLGLSGDEGETWERVEAPYQFSLFGAVPVGEKGALIYGLRGHVFVCSDVRQGDWREIETGSVATMFGGTTLSGNRSVLVGLNGVVVLIDAAGKAHLGKTDAGTTLSAAIPFANGLLAVGESGVQTVNLPH
jgi:photosystem II stability/assembly factor-like uncharacterized protein